MIDMSSLNATLNGCHTLTFPRSYWKLSKPQGLIAGEPLGVYETVFWAATEPGLRFNKEQTNE